MARRGGSTWTPSAAAGPSEAAAVTSTGPARSGGSGRELDVEDPPGAWR